MEDGRKTVDRGGYGYVKDESSWVNLGSGPFLLSFNPVVTGVSLAAILGFAVWAIVMPSEASVEFSNWKTWVGNEFTWLYILSQDAWAVFIIIIFCSKACDIKSIELALYYCLPAATAPKILPQPK